MVSFRQAYQYPNDSVMLIWKNLIALKKFLSILLLIAFLFCYMEWGKTNTAFVFETEYYLFVKTTDTRSSFTHPLILIPLLGQLCILFSLFSKRRSKILVFAGMILMSVLVLFIFLAGILSLNVKMISSCLPFILLSIALIRIYRKH